VLDTDIRFCASLVKEERMPYVIRIREQIMGRVVCWNKRGSDMTQLSFDDNKGINVQ
jgi:hypothetical protein